MSILEAMSSGLVVVTTLNLDDINSTFPYIKVLNSTEAVTKIKGLDKICIINFPNNQEILL